MNLLHDRIGVALVSSVDGLVFRLGICLAKVDLGRHERAVFLDHFACTVLVCKFETVLVQMKRDLCTDRCFGAVGQFVIGTAVAGPVYRCGAFLIR